MKPLLTTEQVCELLQIQRHRLYLLDIPKYKVGGANRYSEEEIQEWLEKNKNGKGRLA